jgi:hypothetical protein
MNLRFEQIKDNDYKEICYPNIALLKGEKTTGAT